MPKVYIPNLPLRFDAATGTRVPALDFNPAAQHGTLTQITAGPVTSANRSAAVELIYTAAEEFDSSEDFILFVGDLILCSAFIAYVFDCIGSPSCRQEIQILRWDRGRKGYEVVRLSL